MMTVEFSKYQKEILNAVGDDRRGNLVVNAVAGSGKTFTLKHATRHIPATRQRAISLAFNKTIATALQRTLPQWVESRTIHSLGYGALRNSLPPGKKMGRANEWKYLDILDAILVLRPAVVRSVKQEDYDLFRFQVRKLADLARLNLWDTEDSDDELLAIGEHHGIVPTRYMDMDARLAEMEVCALVRATVAEGVREWQRKQRLDFTDMIYLPPLFGLEVPPYDFVLVDESQDLSAAQMGTILNAAHEDTRFLFVGDRRQAIQGFAGADNKSFDKIIARIQGNELPLSICYRCPTSHIERAQAIVPQIEAAPWAEEGLIADVTDTQFVTMVRPGDLIICRINSPLIGYAFALIAEGIQARVRGRDVAKDLVSASNRVLKVTGLPFARFGEAVNLWREDEIERLAQRKHSDAAIERANDVADCLLVIYEKAGALNLNDMQAQILALFADENAAVWLSSVHRAKGLEADRVFVLRPDLLPFRRGDMKPWQIEQEDNLYYVALTRAKQALYFVRED